MRATNNNWKELFSLMNELDFNGEETTQKGIRFPETMEDIIKKEVLREIEDEKQLENVSFNKLILACVCDALRINQREDGTFYFLNKTRIKDFIEFLNTEEGKTFLKSISKKKN
jgi:hypothetical protein